jgi:hypothetical protein
MVVTRKVKLIAGIALLAGGAFLYWQMNSKKDPIFKNFSGKVGNRQQA